MKLGSVIYQPIKAKGIIFKWLLPYVYRLKKIRKFVNACTVDVSLDSEVDTCLQELLNVDGFEFSIYCGTNSVIKKPCMQIFKDGKILAYCKVSRNKEVVETFKKEKVILDYLEEKGVDNVPKCLSCQPINNDDYLFLQSTKKTLNSYSVYEFSDVHWKFLKQITDKTKRSIPFEESDFSKNLDNLEHYLHLFSPEDIVFLKAELARIRGAYQNKVCEFAAYHGDFTAANMFVEKGELFVFDLEYAELTFPPYLDWFCFLTQTARFKYGKNESEICDLFQTKRHEIEPYCEDADLAYCSYLLAAISRFVHLWEGYLKTNPQVMLLQWLRIAKAIRGVK